MRHTHFSFFHFIFWLLICLSLWTAPATANDDAYLDALNAEAESSDSTQRPKQTAPKQAVTKTKNKPIFEESRLQLIQRKIEFTTKLSKELPATTRTFYKLGDKQKKEVIDAYYANNKNMSVATQLLFNLYFKNKQSN